jgi:hypothetical protein
MALAFNYEWWTVDTPSIPNPENIKKMPVLEKEKKLLEFSKYED